LPVNQTAATLSPPERYIVSLALYAESYRLLIDLTSI
jgi:hypothetical protein